MKYSGLAACCVVAACATAQPTAARSETQDVDRVEAPRAKKAETQVEQHFIALDDELKAFIMESQGPIESRAVSVLGRAVVMKLLAVLAARNRCLY